MKKHFLLSNLSVAYDDSRPLVERVARAIRVPAADIHDLRIERQSLDARKKPLLRRVMTVVFALEESCVPKGVSRIKPWEEPLEPDSIALSMRGRPVVIGAGPAGQFAALGLVRRGYQPIVIERGQPLAQRRLDVRAHWLKREFNPESNVQFGEGGAGTFSDGKLTARGSNWYTRDVLQIMVKLGASEDILSSHLPHLGTEGIRRVSKNLRAHLEESGVEFRFGCRLEEILHQEKQGRREVCGVRLSDGSSIETGTVLLAIGHSARDTVISLSQTGVAMEAKPFAMGLRIEHPREWVDLHQYGRGCKLELTGSATYKLTAKSRSGQGVYSFCMCPGGMVLPAGSEDGHLTVNGMSWAKRQMRFSNSALVVSLSVEDVQKLAAGLKQPNDESRPFVTEKVHTGNVPDLFAGGRLQRDLERQAFEMAGSSWNAPAQRARDYMRRERATALPDSSYRPALSRTRLDQQIPRELAVPLAHGMARFDQQMPGFIDEGLLIYPETRTSSPLRILRDPLRRESTSIQGLFPLGEGAGYAGGIISSAADGLKTALSFASR